MFVAFSDPIEENRLVTEIRDVDGAVLWLIETDAAEVKVDA